MDTKDSTYKLGEDQLDQALDILQQEQRVYTLTRRDKLVFTFLNIAVSGLLVVFILLIIEHKVGGSESESFFYIALVFAALAFLVATPILFFFNRPLLSEYRHQSKLVRGFGLSEVFEAPWKAERRKRRLRNIFTLIVGGLWLLVAIITGLLSDEDSILVWIGGVSIIVFIGLALFFMHFIRRGKERLEVVEKLQNSLSQYKHAVEQGKSDPIVVLPEDYVRMAQLERAQNSLERAENIEAVEDMAKARSESLEYRIVHAEKFLEQHKKLEKVSRGVLLDIEKELRKIANDLVEHPENYVDRFSQDPKHNHIFDYKHPPSRLELTFKIDPEKRIIGFLNAKVPTLEIVKSLFISYSHKDKQWLLELKKWLHSLEQQGLIAIWDDRNIQAGDVWRDEIEKALASAKAAVLLISQDFLVSDFIGKIELPKLLDKAKEDGLKVLWIAVKYSDVEDEHPEITKYQAAHKDPPLHDMRKPKRDKAFLRIKRVIKKAVEV